jgi:hypothetical protein
MIQPMPLPPGLPAEGQGHPFSGEPGGRRGEAPVAMTTGMIIFRP